MLIQRTEKSQDSCKKLEIDSIVIQSPLLKKVLREVLKDYPGVTASLSRLVFTAPFKPFVHRWNQLVAELDNEHDQETKQHLTLLVDTLHDELKDVIAALEDYDKNKVVTYQQIWTIFQPESPVFAQRFGKPMALRLLDGKFIKHQEMGPCFKLLCERVNWDGSRFGCDMQSHFITPFEGTIPIHELKCFPLTYHPDREAMTKRLIARGHQFESLAGYHYKSYRGQAVQTTCYGPSMVTVEGRIIIDARAYNNANPNLALYLDQLDHGHGMVEASLEDPYEDECCTDYDGVGELDMQEDDKVRPRQSLTEEQLLICTPVIRGFALRTKLWLEFFVDSVSEIVFNDTAFDSLVLPEGHKSLILAISQAHMKSKDVFDDFIAGKGRGIIMLLSGGPGIGKTLTAESVAEHMRTPLYTMSAGDLGTKSTTVEDALTRVLDMVAKWNAVLLLDECDVFLEARSKHDIERNRIVSIFLRTLEYYEGILFLTTNRADNVDEAFYSRIHFRLSYPNLDEKARGKVWKGFLNRQLDGHTVTDEDLEKLEKIDINGRVIKNVLKSATLLASHKEEKLGFVHLKTVLEIDGHKFDK